MKNPDKYIGGKTPLYRSSWEFAFMRFCDESPSIQKWASESIRIPYRHPFTGKFTIYVPDFFIAYADKNGKQHAEVIEIKPENQTLLEKAKSKQNQGQINTLLGRSNILDDRFDSVANKLELADDFQLKITILTDEINNLKEAIRENQEGLSAVDQYRLQNNQKLIDT